jgi:hypothetical protein
MNEWRSLFINTREEKGEIVRRGRRMGKAKVRKKKMIN